MPSEKEIKNLLRKLAEGIATSEEHTQIQEYAQSDPFLAEALEGYQLQGGEYGQDLEEIEMRLQKKSSRKLAVDKVRTNRWQMAAAIMLLLAVGGWMIRDSLTQQSESMNHEQSAFHPKSDDPSASEEDHVGLSNATDLALNDRVTTTHENLSEKNENLIDLGSDKTGRKMTKSQMPDSNSGVSAEVTRSTASDAFEKEINETLTEESLPAPDADNLVPSPEAEIENTARAQAAAPVGAKVQSFQAEKLLIGQVVDEQGEPLIGAKIRSLGSDTSQVTDPDGHFQINQKDLHEGIEVSYIGFKPKTIGSEWPGDNEPIVLEEKYMALDEVVVVKMPARKSKGLKEDRSGRVAVAASPRGGVTKYQAYILQNLRKPGAAIEAKISGTVVLSFHLGKNNRPADVQIESSLGYGCDQEAMRLVENGPKWEGGTSDERVILEIKF